MHAVGDVADGNLILAVAKRVQHLPHAAAHAAVQRADAVGLARTFQRQDRHAKRLPLVGRVHPAQRQQCFAVDAELLAILAHDVVEHVWIESIMSGRHRRVRGKDSPRGGFAECFPQADVVAFRPPVSQLEHRKRAVAFVEVNHARFAADGFQRPHAADAQQQLLQQAHPFAAAVQAASEVAQLGVRVIGGGVQKQQAHAPHLRLPDLRADRAAAQRDFDDARPARGVADQFQRQQGRIVMERLGVLPTLGVDALAEVAFAVKQADPNQRHAQVRGAFEVIAGQDAQAAGVNRQRLVQAEFSTEIRHRTPRQRPGVRIAPKRLCREIARELVVPALDAGDVDFVGEERSHPRVAKAFEKYDRIVIGFAPQIGVHVPKQVDDLGIPRPPQVVRQFIEFLPDIRTVRHGPAPL